MEAGVIEPPQNIVIEIIGTQVQLSWDEVSGANSYKIFASESPDGTFEDVTLSGSFGSARFQSCQNITQTSLFDKKAKSINTVNTQSRTTQTWTASISESKKFYYVIASTE